MSRSSVPIADRIREKKKRFLEREQSIVDATLQLLLENGIDSVTVSDIASLAGVGKGTVYKHFLTKTEILIEIMLNYEKNITEHLKEGIEATQHGDPGAAARAYFRARLEDPALDRLVQQLEVRFANDPSVAESMDELYAIRRTNFDALHQMIQHLIGIGLLEDVPPEFHYMACWALAQGAVEVYFNPGFRKIGDDRRALLDFISGIGVTMGNRGQLPRDKQP